MSPGIDGSTDHYRVLGVERGADLGNIRQAYRRLARQHHPDRHGGRTTPDMVRINEAWRVLSDVHRRRAYDEMLDGASSTDSANRTRSEQSRDHGIVLPEHRPARFPWKFVVGFFALATAVILLVGTLTEPGQTPPIDNIIRVGSCVAVNEQIQEAWEVSCDETFDAQVVSLVPFDGRCPAGTETFRDRQGLGLVCTTD